MGTLTLEVFTSVIESIRLQLDQDRLNSAAIAQIYNTDNINAYDNSLLIKSLVLLLQVHFPKKDNHCEIEHYMFDMNFGKIGDQELITVEDLWYQLTKNGGLDKTISWNNVNPIAYEGRAPFKNILIDEIGHWDKDLFKKDPIISTHSLIDDLESNNNLEKKTYSDMVPPRIYKASREDIIDYVKKNDVSNKQ